MIDDFLNDATLPQLKDDKKAYLERDVHVMEVKTAIKAPLLVKHQDRMVTV